MRVAISIHALSGGGAERVAALLALGLDMSGDDVIVVSATAARSDFYSLPSSVRRVAIGPFRQGGIWRNTTNAARRVGMLRTALRGLRPDVVVGFMGLTNVRTLLALMGTGVPVIVTEHVDPRYEKLPFPWNMLRRWAYKRAAALVSVSRGVDEHFGWLPESKRTVIHNPLPSDLPQSLAAVPDWKPAPGRKAIVSMGRLVSQKGHDLLIRAFAGIATDLPEWDLVILGEGTERFPLERLVRDLRLTDRVHLPGMLRNPFPTLTACDVFALASRFEGFGNVIVEAMACGLPVVVTDCDSGPREIVTNETDGLLVPVEDVRAFEASLRRVCLDGNLRERLASAGTRTADCYRLSVITKQWRRLLSVMVRPASIANPPSRYITSG